MKQCYVQFARFTRFSESDFVGNCKTADNDRQQLQYSGFWYLILNFSPSIPPLRSANPFSASFFPRFAAYIWHHQHQFPSGIRNITIVVVVVVVEGECLSDEMRLGLVNYAKIFLIIDEVDFCLYFSLNNSSNDDHKQPTLYQT